MATDSRRVLDLSKATVPAWTLTTAIYDHHGVECDHCGQAVEIGEQVIHAEPPDGDDSFDANVYHVRCAMALTQQLSAAVEACVEQVLDAAQPR